MKKLLSWLCLAGILCMFCAGCQSIPSNPEDYRFVFTCTLSEEPVTRGGQIFVDTTIQNVTDLPYIYQSNFHSFDPAITLYTLNQDGSKHIFQPGPIGADADADTNIYVVQPGEVRSRRYAYTIPTDAPAGAYHIVLRYKTHSATFEDVFVLE